MVTYDILILSIGLALVVGMWIGILIVGSLMEETLEKQKPKKAKALSLILGEEHYECPNCKGFLSQEYKHCHKCGQALDWSDTE